MIHTLVSLVVHSGLLRFWVHGPLLLTSLAQYFCVYCCDFGPVSTQHCDLCCFQTTLLLVSAQQRPSHINFASDCWRLLSKLVVFFYYLVAYESLGGSFFPQTGFPLLFSSLVTFCEQKSEIFRRLVFTF